MIDEYNENDMGRYHKPYKWTNVALMCYERKCVCTGCEYEHFSSEGIKCQVKAAVLESVKVLGLPNKRHDDIFEVVMDE